MQNWPAQKYLWAYVGTRNTSAGSKFYPLWFCSPSNNTCFYRVSLHYVAKQFCFHRTSKRKKIKRKETCSYLQPERKVCIKSKVQPIVEHLGARSFRRQTTNCSDKSSNLCHWYFLGMFNSCLRNWQKTYFIFICLVGYFERIQLFTWE